MPEPNLLSGAAGSPLDLGHGDAWLEQTEVGEQGTNVRLPQQIERSEQRHTRAAADGNAVAHPGNPPFTGVGHPNWQAVQLKLDGLVAAFHGPILGEPCDT